jgi:hypothetical protein
MDTTINEITSRPNGATFNTEEMILVVEEYIKEKNGSEVNIGMRRSFKGQMVDIDLLGKAFDIAWGHFKEKKDEKD